MLDFLKSKKNKENQKSEPNKTPPASPEKPKGWLQRLSHGLKRTRHTLVEGLSSLILGKKYIDDALFDELEMLLLSADVGVETTHQILETLTQQVKRKELHDPEALLNALRTQLLTILEPCSQPLYPSAKPFTLLMVGINGAGKTTSIAKIAHYFKQQNKQIILAAGDTFRAAAVEQLQIWGKRNNVPVISQQKGADSASVIFDAIQSAMAHNSDLLIADTAGRLHTQAHLMQELTKIKRVMAKLNPEAPHETMLVLDAGIGQNALTQAMEFHQAIGITGITLTKLDGTAKGGIIFAIANKMKLPIRFIGVGEQIDDLKPFDAHEFVDALFNVKQPT
ncbi:MAG: signal recognition particle-docking protein FtsY [Coxiella sp. RIFCSPHIGHO2_12_FULL_42_15]|nr:MAG: signal recognition particle-docking protein FtsY [Coxiella sp. RIFCSPHIGHO2_12_FULL_42_15]